MALAIKERWLRERPASVVDDVIRRGDVSAAGKAFVSGHAIIAFGLATVMAPYLPPLGRRVVWGLAIAVCIARVYVGAHLPLDVMGGAAAGWAVGCLINLALGRAASRSSGRALLAVAGAKRQT